MLLGILCDTHNIETKYVRMVTDDLLKRGTDVFLLPGDILNPDHFSPELFGYKPVVCALVGDQNPMMNPKFVFAPPNWSFTRPGVVDPKDVLISDPIVQKVLKELVPDPQVQAILEEKLSFRRILEKGNIANRIVDLGQIKVYVGHNRSSDVLGDSLRYGQFMNEVNQIAGIVSLICTGHTHHRFLIEKGHMTWINPGAVMVFPATINPADGYEYALFNTDNNEVVFCRIPVEPIPGRIQTVGIIADTGNVTELYAGYWEKLAKEFGQRGTSVVIMVGNHWAGDIGRPEFADFEVYYNLLPDQTPLIDAPSNWHLINPEFPLVDVCGNTFLVWYDLRAELEEQSEYDSLVRVRALSHQYQNRHVDFVLCGQSNDAIFEEGEGIAILSPGDARNKRKFATVCLPERRDITFSRSH